MAMTNRFPFFEDEIYQVKENWGAMTLMRRIRAEDDDVKERVKTWMRAIRERANLPDAVEEVVTLSQLPDQSVVLFRETVNNKLRSRCRCMNSQINLSKTMMFPPVTLQED